MSSKSGTSALKRSQSVPIIVSPPQTVPSLKRCRTAISPPTPPLQSVSDGELDDPYALPGGQDPVKKKSPEKKQRKSTDFFSPIESFQGQNRETLEEFNYLLDGVQDTHPLSVRHSSLLKLVTLLSEPDAFRLLCLNGSFELIFPAILSNLEDSLFQVALLTTAFLAANEKANCRFLGESGAKFLITLATGGQIISTTKVVSFPVAPSRLVKGRPISKRQRNSGSFGSIVRELDFLKVIDLKQWQTFTSEPVSHKLLALWTLVKGVEDPGFRTILTQIGAASSLLPLIHADAIRLVNGAHGVAASASSSSTTTSTTSPASTTTTSSNTSKPMSAQDRLRHYLSIFEHLAHDVGTHEELLGAHESKTSTSPSRPLIAILLDLLYLCNQQMEGDHDAYVSSILLLLVNLTNKSACGCHAVSTAVHQEGCTLIQVLVELLSNARSRYNGRDLAGIYDTITTALGVLINLAESSTLSRQQLLTTQASSRNGNVVKFFAEWFVANDRAYQASVTKAKVFGSPEKTKKKPRSTSCLSPTKATSQTSEHILQRSSSFATLSDNELEEESGVLENQMIACYLSVLLGFLTSNLPEKRRWEVLQHLPHGSASSITGKLKEFLVIQSDASMLMDDTLEAIMGIIETLNNVE